MTASEWGSFSGGHNAISPLLIGNDANTRVTLVKTFGVPLTMFLCPSFCRNRVKADKILSTRRIELLPYREYALVISKFDLWLFRRLIYVVMPRR